MKISKQLLFAASCGLFFLASCQPKSPKEAIIGKWQIESYETPTMDSFMDARKHSIDTMTQFNPRYVKYLGTDNPDSIKAFLKKQLDNHIDAIKKQGKESAAMTTITFLKNGTAVFRSGPQADSSTWSILNKNKLVIAPSSSMAKQAGARNDTMNIENINSNKLRLKEFQGKGIMYINLHPYTKADSTKASEMQQQRKQLMQQQLQQMRQNAQAAKKGNS